MPPEYVTHIPVLLGALFLSLGIFYVLLAVRSTGITFRVRRRVATVFTVVGGVLLLWSLLGKLRGN